MKRLVSLALVLMLVIGCMPVSASGLTDKLLKNGISQEEVDKLSTQVDVPTDILEKFSTESEYKDGPIFYSEEDQTATVDVKAVVDLAPVKTAFNAYIATGKLAAGNDDRKKALVDDSKLYGAFTVTINIPKTAAIPEEYKTNPVGFSCSGGDWADNIYSEISRNYTVGTDADILEINLKVADPAVANKAYMTAKELADKADFYFGTLEFTCPGVVVSGLGDHIFSGKFTGVTTINEEIASIGYTAVQKDNGDEYNEDLTAKVVIEEAGGHYTPPYSQGGDKPSYKIVTVTFNPNGGTLNDDETITNKDSVTVKFDEIVPPSREDYEFTGWAYEKNGATPAPSEVTVTEDTTFYAQWVNVKAPEQLNSEDHEAYVIGYPEGDVRPEANITRAEVTTIFYRLLKDEVRDSIFTTENSFIDVADDFWASKAISTMSNGKYIMGDAGTGAFRPDDSITRAEFAAIATRFLTDTDVAGYESTFTDISGHWAENAIKLGASVGWIAGYEDGTFKPEQFITRAEAMTIINRVLVRYVDEAGLVDGYVKWPDNSADEWYYYNVIEATNSHDYQREAGKHLEKWTQITENQVWVEKAEYEDPEA